MRTNDRRVNTGGLMRCCLETIATTEAETDVDSVLDCRYCSSQMKVGEDELWHWFPKADR
jgi:hypothetical protein